METKAMSMSDSVNAARHTLSTLTTEQLAELPPEELTALIVTLRQTLDRAQNVRTGGIGGKSDQEEWERLST